MPLQIALFATVTFASAFLIFLVQPLVGKHILPWFGGVPAIWSVCLCFYQLALFAGYGYAHWLASRVRLGRHLVIHALLFAGALVELPVLPSASWKVSGDEPLRLHILAMLAANVGLPFVMLAATGPLVQAWYARSFPARSPYVLYAVSNAGSLLALLAFPFVIEPNLPLSQASRLWTWAFAGCGLAVLLCAWLASRNERRARAAAGVGAAMAAGGRVASTPRSSAAEILLWIALPACAVVLFMSVTNQLCLDVASIPFLWVVPLAIYLLTFILSFASRSIYRRGLFVLPAALAVCALLALRLTTGGTLSMWNVGVPIAILLGVYAVVLFLNCMLLHGELYRLRPAPAHLTAYYLCIAGGGSLGGILVGIVAPQVFSEYHELPLSWAASWTLFAIACLRNPGPLLRTRAARRAVVVVAALSLASLAALFVGRPGAVGGGEVIHQKRTFFNVLRVIERNREKPRAHHIRLTSGTTAHGAQSRAPAFRRVPIMYFTAASGIGLVMSSMPIQPVSVGITGLGVGSLAAYGRAGDRFRFYEIDPDVVRIARDEGYFTYLADSPAELEFILGDARLSLELELERDGPQNFDLLILDAFRSDAIPVHLITSEAFDLYLRHLKRDGVIVVHASSANFELAPLFFRQAHERGLAAVAISNDLIPRYFQYSTTWVVMSADAAYIDRIQPLIAQQRERMKLKPAQLYIADPDPDVVQRAPLWTDDYSDLFSVLRPVSINPIW